MPIIRNDIPEGHDKAVKNALYEAVHHAFFDDVQRAFEDIIGTTREDMIVLIRDFPQEACLSEGRTLPPLEALTPELDTA